MIPGWQMEAYERLRTEIVRSAVADYQKALRKSHKDGAVCDEQKKLEKWFLSKWGQLLSGDNGEYIIEKCKQTYNTRTYKNGKRQLPDQTQKKIYDDYKKGMKIGEMRKKYNLSSFKLRMILRSVADET